MPEQPIISVDTRIPSAVESESGATPAWCDFVLVLNGRQTYMTRSSAQTLQHSIGKTLNRWGGASIYELIWEELDGVIDALMEEPGSDVLRGTALGLATAIAYMQNPLVADVDGVRAEAMGRYEERVESSEAQGDSRIFMQDSDADDDEDDDLPFG